MNENENDYAITQAKPEQALRDPRLTTHGGSRGRSPSKRRFTEKPALPLPSRWAQTGMSVLQFAAHEKTTHCPLITARLAGRSYTSTAERYTLFVHEDVCAKVKSCTSTRTIMPSCKQNPSRRSGLPVLSNHLASGHRQECPCYSLRFAMTLTLHYVRMRIAKLEGECPHELWLQGNLNWVNRVSPVNAVKFRVRSPGSGVKIESFDFIDLRLPSRKGTDIQSCPL